MGRLLVLIFIIQAIYYARCSDGGDTGEPLFLTPYIENGKIAEGRRLARVNFSETPEIESYAGFFTVKKIYNSNQFLWYFPSIEADREHAPVILWLQGGPGESSLFGLFTENGPISIENDKFASREFNWASDHHLIYIDNPVGAGFSFTKHPDGYLTDETQIGEQLYSTLTQFFKLFPELQQNKFFVAGESYAGKYVPALAYTIHKKNLQSAETKINLQGIAIGNGLSDPEHQLIYSKYLYQIGLIDQHAQKTFEEYEAKANKYIKNSQWDDAYNTYDALINGVMGKSYFHNVSGFNFFFNYLHTEDYTNVSKVGPMLQRSDVRKQIHVADRPFNNISQVLNHLTQDFTKSVAPWVSELLDHYYCVIYNGQLDIILPYPQTVEYLMNLNFTGAEEYRTADRHIWKVDGEIAGYVKEGGNLLEIMVRNAGHSVPTDQPKWALDMITRFTHGISFYDEEETTDEQYRCV